MTSIAIAQTKTKLTNTSIANSNTYNLDKYLWSYSKSKPGNNDKKILDFETIDNWRGLGNYLLVSNNGSYFAYTIGKGSSERDQYTKLDSLIVASTNKGKRWAFFDANPGLFTTDNKHYLFCIKDTLLILPLEEGKPTCITNVQSYKLPVNGRNEWIVYQLKSDKCNLVLYNLVSGKEKHFSGVSRYELDDNGEWLTCLINPDGDGNSAKDLLLYDFKSNKENRYSSIEDYFVSKNGNTIVLKAIEKKENTIYRKLQYIKFREGRVNTIWSSLSSQINVSNCSLDKIGKQVAFTIQDSSRKPIETQIWYYNEGMDTAIVKVSNETDGILNNFRIQGTASFTENGNYIQFTLQSSPALIRASSAVFQLEVFSYKDIFINYGKTNSPRKNIQFEAIVSTKNERVIPLESEGKELYKLQGDFAIIKKLGKEIHGDRFWEQGYNEDSSWLVSLFNGRQYLLPTKGEGENNSLWFSPGGKYLVYCDVTKGCQYFSYNLHSNEVRSITADVPADELGYIDRFLCPQEKPKFPVGPAAWFQNDEGLLVYGMNDIWLVDLAGKKAAINITNGYGQSHDIVFSLFESERFTSEIPIVNVNENLILRSFDMANKFNGYYHKTLGQPGNPQQLYAGPCFFNKISGCHDPNLSNRGIPPLRARDANVWIVQRQSNSDAPNYYKTKNFKSFVKLTNYQPQFGVNWLTQELHSFQHLDGKSGQGILFKPENFDSSNKYPVVLIFYGAYSNNLHQFPIPNYSYTTITAGVSPLWFLNNGYLVFTPDICVTPIRYGPEASNVIEGAARYLKQLPFVDANKLGCGSHSWSAKLGAYIFTHSNSFCAMAISEGFVYANMINSAFGGLSKTNQLETVEEDFQFGNFYTNKDSWLDQTTIVNADNSKSPLLLLCHNKSSEEYRNQTLQLYTALRRLEKKVWWLKYDKGSHILIDLNEKRDFTIRYMQYFDHYLKGGPAPRWMTQGNSWQLNEIDSAYELDPSGSCAFSDKSICPICEIWNKKFKEYPTMFKKPIYEWTLGALRK